MSSTLVYMKRIRRHLPFVPLYLIAGGGVFGGCAFAIRLALHHPDVQWRRRLGEIPNEDYRCKQYKFYSPNVDYSKLECPAPNFYDLK